MFISIGNACDVKYNIDNFTGCKETYFFDWLLTDMGSVNQILGTTNIDNILFFTNVIDNPKIPTHGSNSRIMIKSLSYCESIHDIPFSYNYSHIHDFIEKYKRRYRRIIDTILTNKSVIYFIRKGKITPDEKNIFIKNIKNINANCNFKLVELLDQKPTNDLDNYFISVNLENYRIKPANNNWKSNYWNWKQIFIDISK